MKYKKTGSFFIALLMIFGQLSAFADQIVPADVLGTEFESAYVLINGLSIMEEKDDETFKPYSDITRGNFAKIAVKLLGDRTAESKNVFEDVSPDSDYCSAVNTLYLYGIIGGNEQNKFNPESKILGSEAVKMLINILNYTMLAENKGGYPNGYMAVAAEIGLIGNTGIAADEPVTYGKAAKLIVNALDLPLFEMTGFEGNYPKYSMDGDKLLYVNLGIEKVRGVVNANSLFAIDGLSTTDPNSIRIGNDSYIISDTEQKNSVGRLVDCYYKHDDASGENEIKCIIECENKNTVTTINADEYDTVSNLEVAYYPEDGKRREVRLDPDVCVIYNGGILDTISDETFDIAMGDLVFIDNDGDGRCDVAYVNSYENILVSGITNDYIYSEYDTSKNIKLDEGKYDALVFCNKDGKNIGLEDIQAGNVLSVFKSIDGKILRAVKSSDMVTGKIENVQTAQAETTVEINGTEYKLSSDFAASNSVEIKAGLEGNFCLDAYGKIYTVTNSKAGNEQFGYLIKAYIADGEESVRVRLMEQDGRIYTRDCEDKVTVDGIKYKNLSQVSAALQEVSLQPIIFKINSKDELIYVDSPLKGANNSNDVLAPLTSQFNGRYKTSTKIFEGKLPINSQTCVMIIPSEPESASSNDFGVTNSSYFANDTKYNSIRGYAVGDDLCACILVLNNASTIKDSSTIYVVKNIVQAVNEDDEEVNCITVLNRGNEESMNTTDSNVINNLYKISSVSGSSDTTQLITENVTLGEGDLVKFGYDARGNISRIKLIYSAASDTMYSVNPNIGDYHLDVYRYAYAEVIDIQDGIVKVQVGGSTQFYNVKNAPVTIYDSSKRDKMRLSKGSYGEIMKGSKCVFISNAGTPSHTVLYR